VTKEQLKVEIAKLHDEHGDALLYTALIEYLNNNLGQELREEYADRQQQ
jgi:hypothetical protein